MSDHLDHPHDDKRHENQRNGLIALGFLVGGLLLTVVYVAGNAYFDQVRYETLYRQRLSVENPELGTLRSRETAELDSYQWRDQDSGTVVLPIERAMELVIQEDRARRGNTGDGGNPGEDGR